MADTLQHSFNLNLAYIKGTPVAHNIINEFDEAGLLLGVQRFGGEKVVDYKQRVLDVFVHRAGSHYQGLVFGISREFGLPILKPLRIYPRKDSSGTFISPDPVILFNGPQVTIYSDYASGVVELQFDRWEQSESAYQLYDMAHYISDNSTSFEVNILHTDFQYYRSMTILDQTNLKERLREVLPQTNKFTLTAGGKDGGLIRIPSLNWSDKRTFKVLVASADLILNPGEYYINSVTGLVQTFSIPAPGSIVQYQYIVNDWQPLVSEVIINRLDNPEFTKKMFEQVLDNDNNTVNGLPTSFGSKIINELYSLYPLYYNS